MLCQKLENQCFVINKHKILVPNIVKNYQKIFRGYKNSGTTCVAKSFDFVWRFYASYFRYFSVLRIFYSIETLRIKFLRYTKSGDFARQQINCHFTSICLMQLVRSRETSNSRGKTINSKKKSSLRNFLKLLKFICYNLCNE